MNARSLSRTRTIIAFKLVMSVCPFALAEPTEKTEDNSTTAISSKIEETKAGELILVETVLIAAPVDKVWAAYTTTAGYTSWAAPVAEIDFRVGGTIRTHYDKDAKIGDPKTNTVRILNYVPRKVLTLQADVSDNWPDIMKEQAEYLYNVILFEKISPNSTRLTSYGLGYRDNPEMRNLMKFFVRANKGLYANLLKAVE
ncbi:MAG: SRPBCC domain-containing protein [Phycisphaerae bacterium]